MLTGQQVETYLKLWPALNLQTKREGLDRIQVCWRNPLTGTAAADYVERVLDAPCAYCTCCAWCPMCMVRTRARGRPPLPLFVGQEAYL